MSSLAVGRELLLMALAADRTPDVSGMRSPFFDARVSRGRRSRISTLSGIIGALSHAENEPRGGSRDDRDRQRESQFLRWRESGADQNAFLRVGLRIHGNRVLGGMQQNSGTTGDHP